MALPTLTYQRYRELGGQAQEEQFNDLLPWALCAVEDAIFPHDHVDDWQIPGYERALLVTIEYDRTTGASHGLDDIGGSFSIGSFSHSGLSQGDWKVTQQRMIARALTGTGLNCKVVL